MRKVKLIFEGCGKRRSCGGEVLLARERQKESGQKTVEVILEIKYAGTIIGLSIGAFKAFKGDPFTHHALSGRAHQNIPNTLGKGRD